MQRDEISQTPAVCAGALKGQLDLFAHSRTVVLLNDVIDSLLERNVDRVCERLRLLREEAPGHPTLQALITLSVALERWPVSTTGAAETAEVVEWLDSQIDPAARALGPSAESFMRSLWRDLAVSASSHAYDPAAPRSHSAYCYLRAGDPSLALQALGTIEGHGRDPSVLQWQVIARYRTSGWRACRTTFFCLALTSPQSVAEAVATLGDVALRADWENFWLDCAWLDPQESMAAAWFPTWYLIAHPATCIDGGVAADDPEAPPGKAFQLMRQLLAIETQGPGAALIAARTELRRIDERMFRHYMNARAEREGSR